MGLAIGNIKPTSAAETKAEIYPYNNLFLIEIRNL
jgi:hypothetical protein